MMQVRQATRDVAILLRGPAENGRPVPDLRAITLDGQLWRGASGRHYTYAVHPLISCPAPVGATYVLARRDNDGRCLPLSVGATGSDVASLNLAQIRREASRLGANEVHLMSAPSSRDRAVALFDISSELSLAWTAEVSTTLQ
jgi:hypothetical protein